MNIFGLFLTNKDVQQLQHTIYHDINELRKENNRVHLKIFSNKIHEKRIVPKILRISLLFLSFTKEFTDFGI